MTLDQTKYTASLLLSATLLLLGTSFILGANSNAIKNMADIFALNNVISVELLSVLAGLGITLTGMLVGFSLFSDSARPFAIYALFILTILPLFSLFSESRWMPHLGGFPVIGSGQGIIKYFALLPILMFLFFRNSLSSQQHIWFNFISIASVLIWIGAMKFYEFEAKGIEVLVANSPLMSWMYQVWDLQTVSNIIGAYDLIAVVILGLGIALSHRTLTFAGMTMAAAVFATTQTFILSTAGGLSAETLLTGLSQFVIKDIWYLINLVIIYGLLQRKQNA